MGQKAANYHIENNEVVLESKFSFVAVMPINDEPNTIICVLQREYAKVKSLNKPLL